MHFVICAATVSDGDGGNAVRTQTVTATAVNPVADAGGPYTVAEGAAFTLDASASTDPNDDPLTITWDLNNDGSFADAAGPSPSIPWSTLTSLTPAINDDGVYPIRVRTTDVDGNTAIANTTLTVTNAAPSIVSMSVPDLARKDVEITFFGAAQDPGDDAFTYEWDFGDGTAKVQGAEVKHTYVDFGNYTVTLSVTDEDGGVVIDVESNEVVCRGLSMPHSPRWYRDRLWVLNSGHGQFGCDVFHRVQLHFRTGGDRAPVIG